MGRVTVPGDNQDQVLLFSRRRCCICFGLHGDLEVKQGQIAHLDRDNTNFDSDNLAFLCLPHHDQYDGKTSQSKGLRESEVKHFRKELYEKIEAEFQSETIERARIELYPVVDFEFMPEATRHDAQPDYIPKLMLSIRNRGESPIQDVRMQATEYTLRNRVTIMAMSKIGGEAPITRQIAANGGESARKSVNELIPVLRFEATGIREHGVQRSVSAEEIFYALRVTFLHAGSQKRYCFYKVISAKHIYLFLDESPFGYGWATMNPSLDLSTVRRNWIEGPRNVILPDQRRMYAAYPEEEYIPGRPDQPAALPSDKQTTGRDDIAPEIDIKIPTMITKGQLGAGLTDLFVHAILTLKAPSSVTIRDFSLTASRGTQHMNVSAIDDMSEWQLMKEDPEGGYARIQCPPLAAELRQRGDPVAGWIHFRLNGIKESEFMKSLLTIKVNSAQGTCTKEEDGSRAFPEPQVKGVMRKLTEETKTRIDQGRSAEWLNTEWKELASRFEKLPNVSSASLQTNRRNNQTTYEMWLVNGDNGDRCRTECKYAGALLTKSPNALKLTSEHTRRQSDPVLRWLYFLKDNGCSQSTGLPGSDETGTLYFHESIREIAATSSRICRECAAHEL